MKKPILLFLLIFTSIIYAQAPKITGTVVDSKGMSIPGVTVTFEDKSTTTDIDGKYSIGVKNSKSPLKFSFIGFETQLIVVGKNTTINVELKESLSTLDEVVVIGYGTQKRSSVTGSVAKYQNEKLNELAVSRVDQALQGKIAGVQVINTSSEAGADPKINIRGAVSINASNTPLVIVDGQQNQDGLGSLNMADVQSVEVLKDAASAAIYGSRGANGVIIVTTKSGKTDKVRFNFKYQTGVKTAYETYPMMTSSEYVKLLYAERELKKSDTTVTNNAIPNGNNNNAQWLIEQELFGGNGTNYQEEALRTGIYKTIGFNASGGSKTTKYYVSFGYNGDEGMQVNSNFEKYNFLTKLNIELSKRVKLDINVNPQYSTKENPSENFTNFIRYPSFLPVYHNAKSAAFVNQNPQYASIKAGDAAHPRHFSNLTYPSMGMTGLLPDGTIMKAGNANPFASAQNNPVTSVLNQSIVQDDYRLQGALNLTVNILPGLDFKTMGSMFMKYTDGLFWSNNNAQGDGLANRGVYTKNSFVDLLWENTLMYKKEIGNHLFDAVVLYSAQKTRTKNEQITGLGYPSDDVRNLSSALAIEKSATTGLNYKDGLLSYMGRLNYSFKDKYVLSVSMRADGSSYFGQGNKWGYFPAGSIGWKLHKESFLNDVDWLSKLLLRASYGVSGNNRIGYFLYEDTFVSTSYPFGTGTGSAAGGLSLNPNIQSNSDITWESTYQTNLGLDLSLFKNRANLNIDVYQSKTDKLLLYQPTMAFTGVTQGITNIGSMKNKGIEIELSTTNIVNTNFKWTTQANISHTENEIIELGSEPVINSPGERGEIYQAKPGNPLIQYYGYKTDGVWLSQAQIDEAKAAGITSNLAQLFLPGGLKLVDVNGDKKIDINDRTIIGNPYPDFIWGMTNLFSYKAFDLSFSLQGSQGGELINGDANYNETKRYNTHYNENRWVSAMFPGDGKTPYDTTGFNWMLTDYVVEDASYVALRDVTIGFTMPTEYVKKFHLNGMRLYFSGSNLFYYSPKGYRGVNSEGRSTSGTFYSNSLIDGYQRGPFPIARTAVFGLDINF